MSESREHLRKQLREAKQVKADAQKDWRNGNQTPTVAAIYRAAENRIARTERRLRRLDLNERDADYPQQGESQFEAGYSG